MVIRHLVVATKSSIQGFASPGNIAICCRKYFSILWKAYWIRGIRTTYTRTYIEAPISDTLCFYLWSILAKRRHMGCQRGVKKMSFPISFHNINIMRELILKLGTLTLKSASVRAEWRYTPTNRWNLAWDTESMFSTCHIHLFNDCWIVVQVTIDTECTCLWNITKKSPSIFLKIIVLLSIFHF